MNGVFFCLYVGMHWDDKMLVREREILFTPKDNRDKNFIPRGIRSIFASLFTRQNTLVFGLCAFFSLVREARTLTLAFE